MIANIYSQRPMLAAIVTMTVIALSSSVALGQNYTGWWWNEAEPGRGVNIGHDGDTLGAAVFLYDDLGMPLWATFAGTLNNNTTSGPLLTFTGPSMNTLFDPTQVQATPLGTARIVFSDNNNATISYDAGSFTGPTTITRFPLGALPVDGRFKTVLETVQHCDPLEIGATSEFLLTLTTAQSSVTISLFEQLSTESTRCVLEGTYAPVGNQVVANGTLICTTNDLGGAVTEEIEGRWATDDFTVTNQWLHANFDANFVLGSVSCDALLKISGLRSNLISVQPFPD